MEKLMTTAEVAAYLNIQPATLEKARSTGLGNYPPYVKIGRLIRYRLSDVMVWVEQNMRDNNVALA